MASISVRELNANLSRVIARAEAGEVIEITRNGKTVVELRAKGASRAWVLWRHVLRNALLPVLTIAGVLFGELLAGAVVTETVFGINGLGRITEQAVSYQDTAVLQAIVILAAVGFVLINLLVDLAAPLIDPRLNTPIGASA